MIGTILAVIAGGAAVGECAHLVVESITRKKEMDAMVEENNREKKAGDPKNEKTERRN